MSYRVHSIIVSLRELNPEAILADGYEDAIIGWSCNLHHSTVAVYDLRRAIEVLMLRDGLAEEEARRQLDYSVLSDVGENMPLFVETPVPLL